MKIEFDPTKDAENIRKHGISLAKASDFVTVSYSQDTRFDYSETRYRAFGWLKGESYCLVFTMRNDIVRAISFRRAHAKEMKRYAPPER